MKTNIHQSSITSKYLNSNKKILVYRNTSPKSRKKQNKHFKNHIIVFFLFVLSNNYIGVTVLLQMCVGNARWNKR